MLKICPVTMVSAFLKSKKKGDICSWLMQWAEVFGGGGSRNKGLNSNAENLRIGFCHT
jgi:hypothetical protein